MASLLIDKLENLKSNEIKLKEEQRVLEEQIAFEMEKKRRMKMDATLTKLEVQIDELENATESTMVGNNYEFVVHTRNIDMQNKFDEFNKKYQGMDTNEIKVENSNLVQQFRNDRLLLVEEKKKLDKLQRKDQGAQYQKITVKEFKNNLKSISEETKKMFQDRRRSFELKPEIKIYDDIIPLFRTMMGVMEKQQREIDELKGR